MREEKKKRLEAQGWKVGNAGEFLGLSYEETVYIELKLTGRKPQGTSPAPTAYAGRACEAD